ncbi:hypothetical protein LSH36_536g01037 [Paralvinella palmiformis]|uniref:Uncharacterized protein n=1 Tax=Paralvinella palmiformis TaxID=53620 RepID=A0AAD9MVY1_9ANNE|nr:hypothetical protein LSH36_536g01037 [Paralvinella palmiformis]
MSQFRGNYARVAIYLGFAVLMMLFCIFIDTFRRADLVSPRYGRDISVTETFSNDTFPKIIHQVWLGYDSKDPPDSWRNATNHSIRNNPDFTYRCWSKDDVIDLLTSHYPLVSTDLP